MKRLIFAVAIAAATAGTLVAQAPAPFKLGTFQRDNRTFVGIVRNSSVIDLAAADAAISRRTVATPTDMRDVIARYDTGLRARIYAIMKAAALASGARPAYVHDLGALKVLPPIMPGTILNAAVNYRAHGEEMARRDSAAAAPGGAARGAA